jgi:hypothetical protein
LLVRGPSNLPKDGAYPLGGVVETDWSLGTFTLNWRLTRPGFPVTFDLGETICMLVPQRRGELESFRPRLRDIAEDPELAAGFRERAQSGARSLSELKVPGSHAANRGWERHYFRGTSPAGQGAPEHQLTLRLRDFEEPGGSSDPDVAP